VFLFPLLIAASCVFTKQHYLVDLPAGAALGWGAYQLFLWMG
jgi:membrane-associated phospholipid phosphatase